MLAVRRITLRSSGGGFVPNALPRHSQSVDPDVHPRVRDDQPHPAAGEARKSQPAPLAQLTRERQPETPSVYGRS